MNATGPTQDFGTANTLRTFARGSVVGIDNATHYDDITAFTSASTMVYNCGPGACGNPTQ